MVCSPSGWTAAFHIQTHEWGKRLRAPAYPTYARSIVESMRESMPASQDLAGS